MRNKIYLLLLCFLVACSGSQTSQESIRLIRKNTQLSEGLSSNDGLIVFDIENMRNRGDSIVAYAYPERTDTLIVHFNKIHYKNGSIILFDSEEFLKSYSTDPWMILPEYDLFILLGSRLQEGSVVFSFNGDLFFTQSNYAYFETYDAHFKGSLFALDSSTPLHFTHNEQSAVIPNYSFYQYEATGFKGKWMKLKVDDAQYDTLITGWVKWKNNDGEPLLKPVYMF